ncbi:hypothetical protein F2Q68_00001780 [Brassica cretica]|uniref:Uncharacterized protein n=1 Tax=Brassica cretica TaxID=69181 RepID=A0A8S9JHM2_BRACR|nr:hypothetical protein F2Q68_00001780 [Brassica cretica]
METSYSFLADLKACSCSTTTELCLLRFSGKCQERKRADGGSVSANHLNNFSDRFSEQDERFRRKAEQQHLALILKSYQESAKPILTEVFLFRHTANCLLWDVTVCVSMFNSLACLHNKFESCESEPNIVLGEQGGWYWNGHEKHSQAVQPQLSFVFLGSRRNAKRGSELMGVDMLFLEESFPFPFKRPTAYFGEQKQTATWSTLKDRSQEAQRVMLTIRLERDVTVCVCLTPWLAFITNLKATEVNQVLSLENRVGGTGMDMRNTAKFTFTLSLDLQPTIKTPKKGTMMVPTLGEAPGEDGEVIL